MNTFTQSAFSSSVSSVKLKAGDFKRVKDLLYEYCGIFLQDGKEALVQSRLMKRMRKLGIGSFSEYLDFIERPESGGEFLSFVDVLTTNKTHFFREAQHFEFIKKNIIPTMDGQNAKWWSAGCSTGEEPVTTAITLHEARRATSWSSVKILATDISREVLKVAKNGVYPSTRMKDVPDSICRKYFDDIGNNEFRVKENIQSMITHGRLNLMDDWPLKGNFHVIMCRNVMIYFNRQTQQEVVQKFYDQLQPGGFLFLGHSESVSSNNKGFKNLAPAVYQKI
ncbi:MAG: protein-glutamate O-methyltransferase CheR [Gracilimonas sp.]|uniref:CheR family methyltransferase n=1 Tax=Gracilimonas TaxID=649462 RepID=UPI001B0A5733|nr:protein-glutamate O-methyltransferase CheR [Gracilimonas sp.]MBO6586884.1 protein-glutamate O-methyltransferase CheR [Gracilimonas sp.]MBO6614628.1 protein-glutamate O-methyltransferase CheR [Gracilimonas sp.]